MPSDAFVLDHLASLFPPARRHPRTADIEADVHAWAAAHALDSSGTTGGGLARRGVGHIVGSCMSEASLPIATLTARYLAWVFVFDDQVAENARLLGTYRSRAPENVLRGGPAPEDDALLTALADLREQIIGCGGAWLLPELSDHLAAYLAACAREAPWRADGQVPPLTDYLHDRIATSGGHALHLHRLDFPRNLGGLPPHLLELADLAHLIGGLVNDLIGWDHDQRHHDPVNLVTVLAHHYGLPVPAAHRAAVVLLAAHKHRFDALHDRLRTAATWCDPHLLAAIAGWVDGCAAAITAYRRHDTRSGSPRHAADTPPPSRPDD
ncbi:terpene synthase family protein [Actinomadura hibisca]|uniref:terpene synthase family protein n=1 Tax=Actinomadura hibisca TaxID=68565 RepID=UPI000A80725E|nr:terpene synthase family protein [Actinomadura hibisca]